jgi:hypothetical protein
MAETRPPPGADVADEQATHDVATGVSASAGAAAKPDEEVRYTCPMHPEVVSPKPGVCPKCGMRLERKTVPPKWGKAHDHQHGAGASP